jgi:DNA-binding XRE family transcriptional regulator
MELSDLKGTNEVLAEQLKNPAFRDEWERTALARGVSERLVAYRAELVLTQTALARQLGMQQPAIARLEAGDHEPSFSTLQRLARHLGMEFHITIAPAAERTA